MPHLENHLINSAIKSLCLNPGVYTIIIVLETHYIGDGYKPYQSQSRGN